MQGKAYHVSYNFKNSKGSGFGDFTISDCVIETSKAYTELKEMIAKDLLKETDSQISIIQVRELKG